MQELRVVKGASAERMRHRVRVSSGRCDRADREHGGLRERLHSAGRPRETEFTDLAAGLSAQGSTQLSPPEEANGRPKVSSESRDLNRVPFQLVPI